MLRSQESSKVRTEVNVVPFEWSRKVTVRLVPPIDPSLTLCRLMPLPANDTTMKAVMMCGTDMDTMLFLIRANANEAGNLRVTVEVVHNGRVQVITGSNLNATKAAMFIQSTLNGQLELLLGHQGELH